MQTAVAPIEVDLGDGERVSMLHRPGTRDRYTIEENWTKHPYRLSRHRGVERRMFIEETYRRLLEAGRTPLILDLGANIGASALALRLYYPGAEIVAVEPEPGNFDLLFRNAFKPARVNCVRAAAASFDGEVSLFDPGRSTDAYRTGEAGGAAMGTIPAVSVPTLLSQTQATPFLAKIDIEGAEAELFSANTDWVDLFPAIAIELHDWMLPGQASSAPFLRCVAERARDFINPSQTDIVFSLRNPD
jgi:FkbM family methyltransferase